MLKPAFLASLVILSGAASAAKIAECLGASALEGTPNGSQVRNYYKASVTQTARLQLRGNYTEAPTSMMTYMSLDVADNGGGHFSSTRPGPFIKSFDLVIGDEVVTETVLDVVSQGKPFSNLVINGKKSRLTVDGKTVTVLCGTPTLKTKRVRL